MTAQKRNEFLDASDGDDHGSDGYDSGNDVAKGARSAKRRKLGGEHRLHEETDSEGAEENKNDKTAISSTLSPSHGHLTDTKLQASTSREETSQEALPKPSRSKTRPNAKIPELTKPLSKKNLVASEKAIKASGVVYLSRIPPFMKPGKLRSLLEPYGTINRTFLASEDPAARTRRLRAGGNRKRLYTEGWVEFVNKREAKRVCELLNARIIGGKKGSYYHDDIWNLLYLKGFKWHHLTDQLAAENAERTSRMRAEISKASRENKEFVKNVERAKMLDGMQAKAKAKTERRGGPDGKAEEEAIPAY